MKSSSFICINITSKSGDVSIRYVNKDHIRQIYEQNNIIYIELTDYETLEVHNENILLFMDRFVR